MVEEQHLSVKVERLIERLATTAMPKAYSEKYLRYLKQRELFSNNNSNEDDDLEIDKKFPGYQATLKKICYGPLTTVSQNKDA